MQHSKGPEPGFPKPGSSQAPQRRTQTLGVLILSLQCDLFGSVFFWKLTSTEEGCIVLRFWTEAHLALGSETEAQRIGIKRGQHAMLYGIANYRYVTIWVSWFDRCPGNVNLSSCCRRASDLHDILPFGCSLIAP